MQAWATSCLPPVLCMKSCWEMALTICLLKPFPWLLHTAKAHLSICRLALWTGTIIFYHVNTIFSECMLSEMHFRKQLFCKNYFHSGGNGFFLFFLTQKYISHCNLTNWLQVYKAAYSEFGSIFNFFPLSRPDPPSWVDTIKLLNLQSNSHLFLWTQCPMPLSSRSRSLHFHSARQHVPHPTR